MSSKGMKVAVASAIAGSPWAFLNGWALSSDAKHNALSVEDDVAMAVGADGAIEMQEKPNKNEPMHGSVLEEDARKVDEGKKAKGLPWNADYGDIVWIEDVPGSGDYRPRQCNENSPGPKIKRCDKLGKDVRAACYCPRCYAPTEENNVDLDYTQAQCSWSFLNRNIANSAITAGVPKDWHEVKCGDLNANVGRNQMHQCYSNGHCCSWIRQRGYGPPDRAQEAPCVFIQERKKQEYDDMNTVHLMDALHDD